MPTLSWETQLKIKGSIDDLPQFFITLPMLLLSWKLHPFLDLFQPQHQLQLTTSIDKH